MAQTGVDASQRGGILTSSQTCSPACWHRSRPQWHPPRCQEPLLLQRAPPSLRPHHRAASHRGRARPAARRRARGDTGRRCSPAAAAASGRRGAGSRRRVGRVRRIAAGAGRASCRGYHGAAGRTAVRSPAVEEEGSRIRAAAVAVRSLEEVEESRTAAEGAGFRSSRLAVGEEERCSRRLGCRANATGEDIRPAVRINISCDHRVWKQS